MKYFSCFSLRCERKWKKWTWNIIFIVLIVNPSRFCVYLEKSKFLYKLFSKIRSFHFFICHYSLQRKIKCGYPTRLYSSLYADNIGSYDQQFFFIVKIPSQGDKVFIRPSKFYCFFNITLSRNIFPFFPFSTARIKARWLSSQRIAFACISQRLQVGGPRHKWTGQQYCGLITATKSFNTG